MNSGLTIFGREVSREGFSIRIGLLVLSAIPHTCERCGRLFRAELAGVPGPVPLYHSGFATIDAARDWLESEARRIAREMLEVAAPLIVTSPELLEQAEVGFGNGPR